MSLELIEPYKAQADINVGDVAELEIAGQTLSFRAVRDSAGDISLLRYNDASEATLLDRNDRLVLHIADADGYFFGGVKHVADDDWARNHLLMLVRDLYGNEMLDRAEKLCKTDNALRGLLDPPPLRPIKTESLWVKPQEARLLRLEAEVRELKLRSIGQQVWSAFDKFPLLPPWITTNGADEQHRWANQARLARTFGIDIWNWKATATRERMQSLWKLISDDPFPRP
jgi:hypothetical protein